MLTPSYLHSHVQLREPPPPASNPPKTYTYLHHSCAQTMHTMPVKALITIILTAPALTLGRTNYEGCTSIEGTYTPTWSGPEPWRTRFYYVPDTFEVCSRLDCGGGRAPPKYTVPGCPAYEGTSTYSPMYLELTTVEAVRGGGMTVEGVLRVY